MPRRPKTSREEVLATALQLVDERGLDALSMRKLADEVGVEAMSLYRHVPNKTAILDGVHEAVLKKMDVPQRTGHWRADTKALANSFRRVLAAHPNTLPLFISRPAVTPGSLHYVELGLEILEGPVPDLKDRIHAFQAIFAFVLGHASLIYAAHPSSNTPVDYASLPGDRFPNLSKARFSLSKSSSYDDFEFGIDALLRGLESFDDRATGRGIDRPSA
ncbi:MAG: TetR/AcrR family transcriptional regulator C-terminal domain-containing protein [Myxococcota bacterium]